MWLADVDYRKPFVMGHRPASFTSSFHGQWVQGGKRVYSVDTINIGNRYSVYGLMVNIHLWVIVGGIYVMR